VVVVDDELEPLRSGELDTLEVDTRDVDAFVNWYISRIGARLSG
jgi:hypothetical protein